MTTTYSGEVFTRTTLITVDTKSLSEQLSLVRDKGQKIKIIKDAISGRSLIPEHDLCPSIENRLNELSRSGEAVIVQAGLSRYWGNPNPPPL